MPTDVFIAPWATGERGRTPRRRRMTRAQRRAERPPEAVGRLGLEAAGTLERLLTRDPLLTGLPVLSGWKPFGRTHYLRGDDLVALQSDLQALLDRDDLDAAEHQALHDVAALARTARTADLVLVVVPD
jgi:hypothetical protein